MEPSPHASLAAAVLAFRDDLNLVEACDQGNPLFSRPLVVRFGPSVFKNVLPSLRGLVAVYEDVQTGYRLTVLRDCLRLEPQFVRALTEHKTAFGIVDDQFRGNLR